MKTYFKFLSLFSTVILIPNLALSECQCPEKPSLTQAVKDASVVFAGRVTNIRKSALRQGQLEVRFSILKYLSGDIDGNKPELVVVFTPEELGTCGLKFVSEQDYLVFASGNPANLKTTSCTRTAALDISQEDVKALEAR
ncbi:hypothetical protein JNK13_05250 [bacterium]|nr:hypothetical protein [bacterium]